MKPLKVALLQLDTKWSDPTSNLNKVEDYIKLMDSSIDLVILPEMFASGFDPLDMSEAQSCDGQIIETISRLALDSDKAIIGSFLCKEEGNYYNRGFFISPSEKIFYDKRHLFRMGEEGKHISAGGKILTVQYKSWRIRLSICYDLRFPVWLRNKENDYDLLVCVASWPKVRQEVWETLLKARALENSAYVIGVNRIGFDHNKVEHIGGSQVIDMKGKTILRAADSEENIVVTTIEKEPLDNFREKFPTYMDADDFMIL